MTWISAAHSQELWADLSDPSRLDRALGTGDEHHEPLAS